MPHIFKASNAGGSQSLSRYVSTLAGNAVWNPYVPEGSAYELAAYVVPADTTPQSVTFSVPSGYRHISIEGVVFTNGATNPIWRVNNDSDTSKYRGHHMWGTGSSTVNANDQTGNVYWNYNPSTSYPSSFVMDWYDYSSTSKYKTMHTLAGSSTNGGTMEIAAWSGLYKSLDPITSITLDGLGSQFSAKSTFTLIGYK